MTYLIGYFIVSYAMMVAYLWHDRNSYMRGTLLIIILWPVSLTVGLVSYGLYKAGWSNDIDETPKHLSMFGFRRPDDKWPGFAVRGFGLELRVWRKRP